MWNIRRTDPMARGMPLLGCSVSTRKEAEKWLKHYELQPYTASLGYTFEIYETDDPGDMA